MSKHFVTVTLFLMAAGSAFAQENGGFPRFEATPSFMYIRSSPNLTNSFELTPPNGAAPIAITGANEFNCAGGGGGITYNLTKFVGFTADLGGCKFFGNTLGLGNVVSGNQFTYLFGPQLTIRTASRFRPFFNLEFGGDRLALSCSSSAYICQSRAGTGTYSTNAFAMVVGGGMDIKLNKRFSLRPAQLEYLYTRFGNSCAFPVCSNNNNQNSFRLKSGIVIALGRVQ